MTSHEGRHSRHTLFRGIGVEGQARLERARVTVIGCGALGSRIAELLGRAGVSRAEGGRLALIDRDYVEESNLQRQALFDENDAARSVPKAAAAKRHLLQIDSRLHVDAFVRDIGPLNARTLLADCDILIDGTDNFTTRFVINDAAISSGIPWIYGGAVGSTGVVAMIVPGKTPCLRCYLETMPPLGSAETCDTSGIITPLPAHVASLQVALALRWLVDGTVVSGLTLFDDWHTPGESRRFFRESAGDPSCPSCGLRLYPALDASSEESVTLCGRNSVQLSGSPAGADLDAAEARLARLGPVDRHHESLTLRIPDGKITIFRDGRVVVEGTTDAQEARSLASRYLG